MLDTIRYVETPEGVEIAVRAAGPVARLGAWLIDEAIRIALYVAFANVVSVFGRTGLGLMAIFIFAVEWFYPVLFEVFLGGATPGKRKLRLVVLHRDGTPVSWTSSLVRNLLVFADFLPLCYGFGLISMLVDRDFRRLGDLAAGTVVARRPEVAAPFRVPNVPPLRPPVELQLAEQRALLDFAERLGTWSGARSCELADLVRPLTGTAGADGVARLVGMASWVLGRRRESFSQQHEREWQELERVLDPAEAETLTWRRLTPPDAAAPHLPRPFPDLYRQVCHQLALVRSRRYGTRLEGRLDNLALRGHQQLYRGTGFDLGGVVPFLRGGFARRVRAEGRLVAAALLLFVGPGLLTAGAVALRPELAYSAMDADTLETLTQQFAPQGEVEKGGRATGEDFLRFGNYIRNNVSIAFRTFAGGVLFGVGSIFFLAYNGIFGAAVAAHVHQMGFDRTFYSYVVGHGAFELTAIVLAGACGLRLGLAVLAPGSRRRARSLAEAARRTVPLLYGTTAMLFVAAFLEAFWSAADWISQAVKLAVGACLWGAVLTYFALAGRHHRA